jgi:hypothetical protein
MGFILAIELIVLLIVFLIVQRNIQRDSSLKSKRKNSARFLFVFGIFCFFSAFIFWYGWSQGSIHFKGHSFTPAAIFYVVYSYFGIKGVVGLFILFGIISIVQAKSLMRKSEQTKEESFADTKPDVKAKSIMTAALLNIGANAFIIAMLYYQVGGMIAFIISIILFIETIGILLYAKRKKKELTQNK